MANPIEDPPERRKDHPEEPEGPMRGSGAGNATDNQAPPDGEPVPNTDAPAQPEMPRGPHTPPTVGMEDEQPEGDAATDTPDASASGGAGSQDPEETADPEVDYRDLYLRARADTENVRKRARRDVGVAEGRGVGRLAKELLPALDNLDRAIQAIEVHEGSPESARGLRLVQQELVGALTRVGIQADSPKGEAFDPHRHEALAQQPVEGAEPGTIVEVYQPGYHYEDVVLRAAKVVVAA
jgi:molecular chaperone GrpE